MKGIIRMGDLVFKYLHNSRLAKEDKLILGFIPWGLKWTGEMIAERLIEVGLVSAHQRSAKDGRIMSVYAADELTTKDVEIACLGFSGIERIDNESTKL